MTYGIEIEFLDDKKLFKLEAQSHKLADAYIECKTAKDEIVWIPVVNIKKITLDKRFIKMVDSIKKVA